MIRTPCVSVRHRRPARFGRQPRPLPSPARRKPRHPPRPQRRRPTPAPDDGDIVVTARRRTENLQDVPLAISVIGGEQLDATGSVNVQPADPARSRALQFYSTNPRNTAANIRGIGAPFGLTNDGIEQGVGIYVDEVYYSRIASATFDFLDVEQIEVLRGPQGTLYGKNTTAGAINITTREPTFDFEGRGRDHARQSRLHAGQGVSVSGPLVDDTLAVRVAGSRPHRRGTIYNVTTDSWVNEQDNLGLRGQLLWRPSRQSRRDPLGRLQPPGSRMLRADLRPHRRDPAPAQPPVSPALAAAFGYAPPSTDPSTG